MIFSILVPIYLIIGLGYLSVRHKLFDSDAIRAFGMLVVRICLPCTIVFSLNSVDIRQSVDAVFIAIYALGSLLAFGIIYAIVWRRKSSHHESATLGLGASMSNSAFMGFPIAAGVIGSGQAATALVMCMIVENILIMPLWLALVSRQAGSGSRLRSFLGAATRTLLNPIVLAIFLGLGLAWLDWRLPAWISKFLSMLGGVSSPVALFVVGGVLAQIQSPLQDIRAFAISFAKLLLHPLLIWGVLALFGGSLGRELFMAAIIFAAMPMASIYTVLAQRCQLEKTAASVLFTAILVSPVTITALLYALAESTQVAGGGLSQILFAGR